MNTIEKLNTIFCIVFDDESILIAPEMTANDVDGWDSLSHINLVIMIEKEFKIRFSKSELRTFRNVGDLLKGIEDKTR
jgi:acyl carrier protein